MHIELGGHIQARHARVVVMTKRPFARDDSSFLTEDDPERLEEELKERLREIDTGEVEMIPGEVAWRLIFGDRPPRE